MRSSIILIVGENGTFSRQLAEHMPKIDARLIETPDKKNALRILKQENPHLILIHSTGRASNDGFDVAEKIREENKRIPIIFVTRHSSENRVIAALRLGLNDYYRFPVMFNDLMAKIQIFLDVADQTQLRRSRQARPKIESQLIGQSQCMRDIQAYLVRAAASHSTVLLTGETGTGKGLAAQLIHQNSARRKGPFVPVNCPAIPENLIESELFGFEKGAFTGATGAKRGKFELAHNGTLFLDEISDMGLLAQAKILRTIEDKENFRLGGRKGTRLVVRVVAATNQEPEKLVAAGRLRQDLFYRLNVARIKLPPLRSRREDIQLLADHFISIFNRRLHRRISGISHRVTQALLKYDWPGNVRELSNMIEASFIHTRFRTIRFKDLPVEFCQCLEQTASTQQSERDRIIATLVSTKGNKSHAAKNLNWSRMTLYRKISKYNLTDCIQRRKIA